jgi:FixJ family two-component response regulator
MIFIVDRDPATRDSLHFLLEAEGLQPESFASGTTFLDRWSPSGADCLILDMDVSDMRSLDLVERMRVGGITLPVVAAISLPTLVARRRLDAADTIAEKPYTSDEIPAAVHRAMRPLQAL